MVTLPSLPDTVPEVRAPRPSVGPGQIAAPYQELAANLDKIGEVVSKDIAVPFAEEAGHKAVRTGPDGQLIVDKAPIFGPASEAYARAARFTYMVQVQPKIEDRLTELKLQYHDKPGDFQAAAKGYVDQLVGNIQDESLRGPVQKIALEAASHNYRSLLVQSDATNRENFLVLAQSRLTGINEELTSLARQGGVNTPEYARRAADRAAILHELTKDPRLHFPQAKAMEIANEAFSNDKVQAVIGEVVREYQTKKNGPEAQKALQDAFWGPGSERLALSAQKRDHGVTEGLKALTRMSAEDTAELVAFKSTVNAYVDNMRKAPATFDDVTHGTMVERARQLGDVRTQMQLDAARIFQPMWQAIKGLPPGEANAAIAQLARGVVPAVGTTARAREAFDFFTREKGYSPTVAAAMVGHLVQESGLDPTLSHDNGIGLGIAGWNRERLDALRKFAGDQGKPVTDLRTQLEFVDRELKGSEAASGARAAGAGNVDQATRELMGFFRPAGWTAENPEAGHGFINRVANARALLNQPAGALAPGQSVFASSNPWVMKLWESTVGEMRVAQGENAKKLADQIVKMANSRDAVPADTLAAFVAAAHGSGHEGLIEQKVAPALAGYDAWRATQGLGPMAGAALQSQITALKAAGVDPIKHQMLDDLSKSVATSADEWRDHPVSAGVRAGMVDPIHSLDPSNPTGFAGELADREKKIGVLRARVAGLGPSSALGPHEGEGLKTALTQGDPAQAAGLLGTLATTLSPENYRATMASEPMKQALDGMIRSYDPTRLNAAMSTLDRLERSDPQFFHSTFGEGSARRLQTWQAWKDSLSPQQMAERFQRADDPSIKTAREHLEKEAEDKVKSLKPADIANQLGNVLQRNVPFVNQSPPVEPLQAQRLRADYDRLYRERYVDTGDADKAKDQTVARLKTMWGPSVVANGALMLHPPENHYPMVNGSHDWMKVDLENALEKETGRRFITTQFGPEGVPEHIAAWSYKVLSDPRTEADISAQRPPSYVVKITDLDTGRERIPLGTNGLPRRFSFDPGPAQEKARAGFAERRDALDAFSLVQREHRGDWQRTWHDLPSGTEDRTVFTRPNPEVTRLSDADRARLGLDKDDNP